jgi:hypothetical protein
VQQAGYPAKTIQQFLRQGQDVFAFDAGAQQQGEQLGIAQGAGPALQQLFARTGVGGQGFESRNKALHGRSQWGEPDFLQ